MSKKKYKTILHYIIQECGSKPSFGKTVLWKLLYFIDFDFYELYEERLTGETYRNIDYGPAPEHFKEIVRELKSEKKITEVKEKTGPYDKTRYMAIDRPDLNMLSGNEIEVVNNAIRRYSSYNANKIKEISHQDMPVKATEPKKRIDYELVFYREPVFSVRSYEEDD